MPASNRSPLSRLGRRAYTLVEVLVVVTVMGIAAGIVVPSLAQTGVLRVQGAIRTMIADMTIAQSDAIAFQKGRAIILSVDATGPHYTVCEVNGPVLNLALDTIKVQNLGGEEFGFMTFENINLPNSMFVMDELGTPVAAPAGSTPAPAGSFDMVGSGQRFRVNIEAYTGRISVDSLPLGP